MKQQLWQRRAYLLADVDTVREVVNVTWPTIRRQRNSLTTIISLEKSYC